MLRESALTGLVAGSGNGHAQSFVRALGVVDRQPVVEETLSSAERGWGVSVEHFGLKRAVKAFVLALSLRMARAAVEDADTQAQEPDGEECIRSAFLATPAGTVVHEQSVGQSARLEDGAEFALDGVEILSGA